MRPYINAIYKVILLVISRSGRGFGGHNGNVVIPLTVEILEVLEKILASPGITKLVQLQHCATALCSQLDSENVLYRRSVKVNLKKLNFLRPKECIQLY